MKLQVITSSQSHDGDLVVHQESSPTSSSKSATQTKSSPHRKSQPKQQQQQQQQRTSDASLMFEDLSLMKEHGGRDDSQLTNTTSSGTTTTMLSSTTTTTTTSNNNIAPVEDNLEDSFTFDGDDEGEDSLPLGGLPPAPFQYSSTLFDGPLDPVNEGAGEQDQSDSTDCSNSGGVKKMHASYSVVESLMSSNAERHAKKPKDEELSTRPLSKTTDALDVSPTLGSRKKKTKKNSIQSKATKTKVGKQEHVQSRPRRHSVGEEMYPAETTSASEDNENHFIDRLSQSWHAPSSTVRPISSCLSRFLPRSKEAQMFLLHLEQPDEILGDGDGSNSNLYHNPNGENNVPSSPFTPTRGARNALIVESFSTKKTKSGDSKKGQQQRKTVARLEYCKGIGKDRRVLRDEDGNRCAVIHRLPKDRDGHYRFKICGSRPISSEHRRSNDTGLYTWATVKNTGGILGVQFTLQLRGGGVDGSSAAQEFVTDSFGPSLFKWGKPRGYEIRPRGDTRRRRNHKGSYRTTGIDSQSISSSMPDSSCAQLTYMGDFRGLKVGRNVDLCLMICFAAIIDEMVEHRMR